MRLGSARAMAGFLAAAIAGAGAASAQSTPPVTQAVPDAPRPQTLPTLNTITPMAPAVNAPAAPANTAPAPNASSMIPGSTLPSASAPSAGTDTDADAVPEIPAEGQGPSTAYRLGTVNVNFVEIPFTVKDSKGQLVPGLSYRDIRIYENGLRQSPRLFTVDPFPLSVALVIDQSVTFDTMEKINTALGALQSAFTPYDEVAVFTYNNGVTKQTDFTAAQSNRLGVILERSKGHGRDPVMGLDGPLAQTTMKNNQQVDPNTTPVRGQQGITTFAPREFHTLNDAILEAAQATAKVGRDRRRVVYVVSDGKEYGSKAKISEVIRYLQTNKISVYATLVGDSSLPGMGFLDRIHIPLTMRDDVLPRYTSATGGQFDPEFRPKGIETSFAKLTEIVRTQYTVGYYSHESALDDKYRTLDVRVLRPNLTVIAKPGYYPSASDSRPSAPSQAPASKTAPATSTNPSLP